MKNYLNKFRISCDRGSLSIGNAEFVSYIPTSTGDGSYNVYLSTSYHSDYPIEFVAAITGKSHVFNYDCLSEEDRATHIEQALTLPLDGYYGIYRSKRLYPEYFVIVKWA